MEFGFENVDVYKYLTDYSTSSDKRKTLFAGVQEYISKRLKRFPLYYRNYVVRSTGMTE